MRAAAMKQWDTKTGPKQSERREQAKEPEAAREEVSPPNDVLDRTIWALLQEQEEMLGETLAQCRAMVGTCKEQITELNEALDGEE